MQKVVAYCVAGGILLIIADEAPTLAVATAGLILLGVALTHSDQIAAVSTFIAKNTGSK